MLRFLLLSATALTLANPATAQQAATNAIGTTAKGGVPPATAEAKKWQGDAILTQVQGRRVAADGTALWDYVFFSRSAPKGKNCALVNVVKGKTDARIMGGCEETAISDFMDSKQALDAARTNGVKSPGVTMFVMVMPVRGKKDQTVWSVYENAGMKTGELMLSLDPLTGAEVGRMVQR